MNEDALSAILCFASLFVLITMACLGGILTVLLSFRKEWRDEFKALQRGLFSHRHKTDGSVFTRLDTDPTKPKY